jgi:hypothetical protein
LPPEWEPVLGKFQPSLAFDLIELLDISCDRIWGNPESIHALRLLKAFPADELLSRWIWDDSVLQDISLDALERAIPWITSAGPARPIRQRPVFVRSFRLSRTRRYFPAAEHPSTRGQSPDN